VVTAEGEWQEKSGGHLDQACENGGPAWAANAVEGATPVHGASSAVDWKAKFNRGSDLAVTGACAGHRDAVAVSLLQESVQSGAPPVVHMEAAKPDVVVGAEFAAAAPGAAFEHAVGEAAEALAHLGA